MNKTARRRAIYGTARTPSSLGVSQNSRTGTWREGPPARTGASPTARPALAPALQAGPWACADCDAAIASLPFVPIHPKVRCPACHFKARVSKSRPTPTA